MTIELKPTNLIAVGVPENARDFIQEGPHILSYMTGRKEKIIHNPGFHFRFIGTISATDIWFDAEPFVEGKEWIGPPNFTKYANYGSVENAPFWFEEAIDSFYSLLHSNGAYFVNPIQKPDILPSEFQIREYEEAQSRTSEVFAILEKENPDPQQQTETSITKGQ
jgi:hypothetical protein